MVDVSSHGEDTKWFALCFPLSQTVRPACAKCNSSLWIMCLAQRQHVKKKKWKNLEHRTLPAQKRINQRHPESRTVRCTEERQCLCMWECNMRNPVTVLTTLLSVEFVLYTISLCSPQWLVETEGASEGLFAGCSIYQGVSSCMTFPAWLGKHAWCHLLFVEIIKHQNKFCFVTFPTHIEM